MSGLNLSFAMPEIRLPSLGVTPDLSIYARPNQATSDYLKGLDAEKQAAAKALTEATNRYRAQAPVSGDPAPSRASIAAPDPATDPAGASTAVINQILSRPQSGDQAGYQFPPPVSVTPLPPTAPPMPTQPPMKPPDDAPIGDDGTDPNIDRVVRIATDNGVPPNTALSMVDQESGWNSNAVSRKGAQGLMQVGDGTAREMGYTPQDMKDPAANIDAGTRYFAKQLAKYGDQTNALIAYNWGPGNTDKWLASGGDPNQLPAETQAYVRTVLGRADRRDRYQPPGAQAVPNDAAADPGKDAATPPPTATSTQSALPANLYYDAARRLAVSGNGAEAQAMIEKGHAVERNLTSNVLTLYDKDPQTALAMARQYGITVPAPLLEDPTMRAGYQAATSMGYEDPAQIAAATKLYKAGVTNPAAIAKQVGPANGKPTVAGAVVPSRGKPAARSVQGGDGASADAASRPTSQADFDALPSGAYFINPADGSVRRKR